MAVPAQRDPEATRSALTPWLAERLGATDVELTELPGPAFSGFSNETLLLDAAWTSDGERKSRGLCVRVEPSGHQVFPDTLFEPQVKVIRALHDKTTLPVPEILWYEEDSSILGRRFFVMGRIEGRAPPDNPPYHMAGWLHEVSPAVREAIWWNGLEAMATVHGLDAEALGLGFLETVDAAGRLKRDRDYHAWVLGDRSFPLVEETFDQLEASIPSGADPPAFRWGDSRIGNILYDEAGTILAVVDWEMAEIGNPVADLAWFLLLDRHHSEACDVPRLEGFPSHAETIARWESLTGRSSRDLGWWMLRGAAHYASIITRVMDLLEDTGVFPGARAMAFENTATKLLHAVRADARL